MKVVILAGGLGTRISEESHLKPKPMIEIGPYPILIHIMRHYSMYGFDEFIICGGYKCHLIKEYFRNYVLHNSDCFFDLSEGTYNLEHKHQDNWKVSIIDTGESSMTGGRILRIKDAIDEDSFLMTYGDGLSDINIKDSVEFHKSHNGIATVSAVHPPARFGALDISEGVVTSFQEKPAGDGGRINGGYFVLDKEIFDYIEGDDTIWEKEPLEKITKNSKLYAYIHDGFWASMDTKRDKDYLNEIWNGGCAKWGHQS